MIRHFLEASALALLMYLAFAVPAALCASIDRCAAVEAMQ